MTFIDVLNSAVTLSETSYIKFLYQYKFKDKTLHFFFEGLDDQAFYLNFIESIFPEDYICFFYVANGKDNVYQNYKDINWKVYNKNRVMFFTDKDFDDFLGKVQVKDENIFETKYYSIENYLVTEDTFGRFLREICYITNDAIIDNLKDKFTKQLKVFSTYMIPLSAWMIYCRSKLFKVNFSDIDMANLFELNSNFEIKKTTKRGHEKLFEYVCSVTKTSYFDYSEIKKNYSKLKATPDYKLFLRGKYELWFFYAFCKNTVDVIIPKLNEEIKKHNKINTLKLTKCKVTISIKPENILQIAAPRVRVPKEISNFLNNNLTMIK